MSKQIISRINIAQYENAFEFEKFLVQSRLTLKLKALIKIRVSQINRCAFCVNLHIADLRTLKETDERIDSIKEWRKTAFFDETERAVLAFVEELIFTNHAPSDETVKNVYSLLDDITLAQVIIIILATNAWNKIAIGIDELSGFDYILQTAPVLKVANVILYQS